MTQKRRRRRRKKLKKSVRIALKVLLSVAVLAVMFLLVSELVLRVEMPADAGLSLSCEPDGSLRLSWQEVSRANIYQVDVLRDTQDNKEDVLYSAQCEEPFCSLPASVMQERSVVLRVNTGRRISLFGRYLSRSGRTPLRVRCYLDIPQTKAVRGEVDESSGTLTIRWNGISGDGYKLYLLRADGTRQLLKEAAPAEVRDYYDGNDAAVIQNEIPLQTQVTYGEGGDLPLPVRGEDDIFLICTARGQEQVVLYGQLAHAATIMRDDLLEKEVRLEYEARGENRFSLSWNETSGEGYHVQHFDRATGEWMTVCTLDASMPRQYETGYLAAAREHRMRVITYGGKLMPDGEYAALPGEVRLRTEVNALYATIWPTAEQPLYAEAALETGVGTVALGEALCVLGEEDGAFRVRTDSAEGYVDSNRCLINLPDYVGDLCGYNVTNCYCSIYRVQGYAMPEITGTCIPGFEEVLLNDGSFIVPLLYPVAKKFAAAAQTVYDDGYQIIVYDAFRPYVATRHLYDTTELFLDEPLPEEPYTPVTLEEYLRDGPKLPEETELPPGYVQEEDAEGEAMGEEEVVTLPDETDIGPEDAAQPEEGEGTEEIPEEVPETYRWTIMDGKYPLTYYFAEGTSSHNLGVALDIWIINRADGMPLEMQSPMHDLSYLSALDRNNANAVLLQTYMREAGFTGLITEWWHFLDSEAKESLRPEALLNGLSVAGWKADDAGWRYRLANGTYYKSMNAAVNGREYRFDERGYTER